MPDTCCQNDMLAHIKSRLAEVLEDVDQKVTPDIVRRDLVQVIDEIAAYSYVGRYTPDSMCLHHALCDEASEMLMDGKYLHVLVHQQEHGCGSTLDDEGTPLSVSDVP